MGGYWISPGRFEAGLPATLWRGCELCVHAREDRGGPVVGAQAQDDAPAVLDPSSRPVDQLLHHRLDASALDALAHRRIGSEQPSLTHQAQNVHRQRGELAHQVVGVELARGQADQVQVGLELRLISVESKDELEPRQASDDPQHARAAPQPAEPAVDAPNTGPPEGGEAATAAPESVLSPETMLAGITLAGYHIERGARTFAALARAMIADLGDWVKDCRTSRAGTWPCP
jgi:hypothetical protein